jgi:hypothetical protein
MDMTVQITLAGNFPVKRFEKNAKSRSCIFSKTEHGYVVTHKANERDPFNWARKFLKRNHRWISSADVSVTADGEIDEDWDKILNDREYAIDESNM